MRLFPRYATQAAATTREHPPVRYTVPRSPAFYAARVTFVETAGAAWEMADLARQCPVSHVGLDTEFSWDRPGVVIDGSQTVLINNLPACRLGDTIIEALGPPNKIIMGLPTVIIGG